VTDALVHKAYLPEAGGRPIVVVYTGAADYPETLTGKDAEHAKRLHALLTHGEEALRVALRTLRAESFGEESPTVRALRAALGELP